jgi:hypothetical protein
MITGAMLVLVTYTFGLSLISQAYPAGQTTRTLSSTGSIQIQTSEGIGIYQNFACTTELTTVPWGTLQPGGSQQVVCYIKNEGSSPTTLSLQTDNWTPGTATNYLSLDWDYNGASLNADDVVTVTLTLSVDSGITGITTFGFDIIIAGSE